MAETLRAAEDGYVSLKQLAIELGLDRSNTRKYVLRNDVRPHKRRTPDSCGQLTLALTVEEAEIVRTRRRLEGFVSPLRPIAKEAGVFYVVRIVPELDPRRIKLGFAEDLTNRLAQHRTAAPTAEVVASWPCRRSWESTVIDCLAAGCRLILNEVYECDDLRALLDAADRLFALLPRPDRRVELSDHSPYNT